MTQKQRISDPGAARSSFTLRGSRYDFEKIAKNAGFEKRHRDIPMDRTVFLKADKSVHMVMRLRTGGQGKDSEDGRSELWINAQPSCRDAQDFLSITTGLSMTSPRASFDGRLLVAAFPMKNQSVTEGQTWEGGHKDPDRYHAVMNIHFTQGGDLNSLDFKAAVNHASNLETTLHYMLDSQDILMLECRAFNEDLAKLLVKRPAVARDGFISGWMREVKIALSEFNDAPDKIIKRLAKDPLIKRAFENIADKEETPDVER